ncbi:uncharacterized protein [Procambarus clarkii]|uniref:uncharacterized protein n=1 Tax=Procambarus clarkii TaxID=6728 RepID=UPI003743AAB0
MERPHGGSFKDGSSDKSDKGTTSGDGLSSCGSSSGPASTFSSNLEGEVEEKMEVDQPLLLPLWSSLPSSSSITITKPHQLNRDHHKLHHRRLHLRVLYLLTPP